MFYLDNIVATITHVQWQEDFDVVSSAKQYSAIYLQTLNGLPLKNRWLQKEDQKNWKMNAFKYKIKWIQCIKLTVNQLELIALLYSIFNFLLMVVAKKSIKI